MSLNQGEKKHPPDWDTVKSTQTREQQKSSIDHSLQSSIEHLLICLRQKDTEIDAAELQVMLQETIDARKVLVESRSDARIKVLLVEKSTRFPPFLTSYVGIRTLVPEILSNRPSTKNPSASTNPHTVPEILSNRPSTKNPSASTNIQKETTALNDNIHERALSDLKVSNADTKESYADIKAQLAQLTTLIALASPKSTRASSTSVFPPVSKATFMNEIDVNSDDIETKTKATDILIASKIQELHDTDTTDILVADKIKERHFLSVDMPKSTRASSNSIFPRFSTPYVGIRSSVPAPLAADTPSSRLAEISNLEKQPLELTTNKPANPVPANLPVRHDVDLVTEEFITISTNIEVSIEEQDSPISLPDTHTSSQVKTPPFPCISHSDAYGGTSTGLVHLKFSTLQDKLLLHDFSKLIALIGQFILHAQSNPKNINWIAPPTATAIYICSLKYLLYAIPQRRSAVTG
jgi:hypothetical protein